jgi:hypothetical protein
VFFGMRMRNYSLKGVWLASALSFSTFWIYMRAGFVAVLGLKRAFGVTAKGVGGAIPLRSLWMEFTMFLLNCVITVWGLFLLLAGGGDPVAYGLNTLWAGYHAVLLSTMFLHFNKRVTVVPGRPSLFEPARLTAG